MVTRPPGSPTGEAGWRGIGRIFVAPPSPDRLHDAPVIRTLYRIKKSLPELLAQAIILLFAMYFMSSGPIRTFF